MLATRARRRYAELHASQNQQDTLCPFPLSPWLLRGQRPETCAACQLPIMMAEVCAARIPEFKSPNSKTLLSSMAPAVHTHCGVLALCLRLGAGPAGSVWAAFAFTRNCFTSSLAFCTKALRSGSRNGRARASGCSWSFVASCFTTSSRAAVVYSWHTCMCACLQVLCSMYVYIIVYIYACI